MALPFHSRPGAGPQLAEDIGFIRLPEPLQAMLFIRTASSGLRWKIPLFLGPWPLRAVNLLYRPISTVPRLSELRLGEGWALISHSSRAGIGSEFSAEKRGQDHERGGENGD